LEDEYPGQKRPLPHGIFTAIFLNLLLDHVSGIAHQTRVAVASVSENVTEEIMESEILNGVIAGLENLFNDQGHEDSHEETEDNQHLYHNELSYGDTTAKEEEERKAELAKMLVVVVKPSERERGIHCYRFWTFCFHFCASINLLLGMISSLPQRSS